MSLPDVKKTEPQKPFMESDGQLVYKNVLVGQEKGELIYDFEENQLTGGIYRFLSPLPSSEAYTARYNKVKAYLIGKYGSPISDTVNPSESKGPVQSHSAMWMGAGRTILLTMDNNGGKAWTTAIFSKGPKF